MRVSGQVDVVRARMPNAGRSAGRNPVSDAAISHGRGLARVHQRCGTEGGTHRGELLSGDEMNKPRTIDTHTHILTLETAALLTKEGAKVTITPDATPNCRRST